MNETNEAKRGVLHKTGGAGRKQVLRGSNVCLYTLREASQGEPLYIDVSAFIAEKRTDSKAFHSQVDRVGFQRSAPQNNYRRLIAAYVPAGEFCFDTVSYIPRIPTTRLPVDLLLGLLNSKLLDWYFRLGSTNSKVNEYQFANLPCPMFREAPTFEDEQLLGRARQVLESAPLEVPAVLGQACTEAPFSPAISATIAELARRIRNLEETRGPISRAARSCLRLEAQPFQDAIDLILFRLAGYSDAEVLGIEHRLEAML